MVEKLEMADEFPDVPETDTDKEEQQEEKSTTQEEDLFYITILFIHSAKVRQSESNIHKQ